MHLTGRVCQVMDIEDAAAVFATGVGCCGAQGTSGAQRGAPVNADGREIVRGESLSGLYGGAALKLVHLEITDKCNAACPQCARNDRGGAGPCMPCAQASWSGGVCTLFTFYISIHICWDNASLSKKLTPMCGTTTATCQHSTAAAQLSWYGQRKTRTPCDLFLNTRWL